MIEENKQFLLDEQEANGTGITVTKNIFKMSRVKVEHQEYLRPKIKGEMTS